MYEKCVEGLETGAVSHRPNHECTHEKLEPMYAEEMKSLWYINGNVVLSVNFVFWIGI